MQRRARVINFAIRPECRRHLRRQMLDSSKSPGVTDGCVRSASSCPSQAILVRTRNSGENEADFLSSSNSPKNQFAEKCTCREQDASAYINVSRGQIGDKVVAIGEAFC
jgi:hypothetical protein